MTIPREARFVVANWVAAAASVLAVVVGTLILLAIRDQLPDPLVFHWDNGEPDIFIGLDSLLLLAGSSTLGTTAVVLLAGRRAVGSWRHTWSSGALWAAVGLPVSLYGLAWVQRNGPVDYPPPSLPMFGVVWGSLAANVVRAWLRPRRQKAIAFANRPLEAPVRLAWVGTARMPWAARIGSAAGLLALMLVFGWWTDAWGMFMAIGAVGAILVAFLYRTREVAVDYSGVGMRGGGPWVPSPIKMGEIRSVSVKRVSALRDFAGWGHRVAADGTEGWITRSGEALVVHRNGTADFVFTVDDASSAAAVLNTFLARSEVA